MIYPRYKANKKKNIAITLLHSERPKPYRLLAILTATGFMRHIDVYKYLKQLEFTLEEDKSVSELFTCDISKDNHLLVHILNTVRETDIVVSVLITVVLERLNGI